MNIPTFKAKDGHIKLMQANFTDKSTNLTVTNKINSELKNFRNMAYQGNVFFGES